MYYNFSMSLILQCKQNYEMWISIKLFIMNVHIVTKTESSIFSKSNLLVTYQLFLGNVMYSKFYLLLYIKPYKVTQSFAHKT